VKAPISLLLRVSADLPRLKQVIAVQIMQYITTMLI